MQIAICSNNHDLNSQVDERFGRCAYFVVVDETGNLVKAVSNSSLNSPQGAGIAAAQLLINNQVDTVLTGRMGPKAMKPLQAAGIDIYTGISGTVEQTLDLFFKGSLTQLETANSPKHGGSLPAEGRA